MILCGNILVRVALDICNKIKNRWSLSHADIQNTSFIKTLKQFLILD